jgi:hypothetical protein
MRALIAAVILLLALAASGLMYWFGGAPAAAPISPAAAPSPAPRSTAEPGALEPAAPVTVRQDPAQDSERVAIAAPPPKPRKGIEDVGAAPIGIDYRPRYAHVAREALLEKLTQLENDVETTSGKLFEERFAANKFTTQPIAANDGRALDEIIESLTAERELCSTRLVMSGTAAERRPQAVQIVCLPRAQFPELYAMVDERDWLSEFINPAASTDK